jgi:hypothetical protein
MDHFGGPWAVIGGRLVAGSLETGLMQNMGQRALGKPETRLVKYFK